MSFSVNNLSSDENGGIFGPFYPLCDKIWHFFWFWWSWHNRFFPTLLRIFWDRIIVLTLDKHHSLFAVCVLQVYTVCGNKKAKTVISIGILFTLLNSDFLYSQALISQLRHSQGGRGTKLYFNWWLIGQN